MLRSTFAHSRARPILYAIAAGVFCVSTAGFAQSSQTPSPTGVSPATPSAGDTVRLSDEERNAILASNTSESAATARGERVDPGSPGRGIHGEVGAMIGSNGARGAYGTAAIPLGENAGAVVSFESSRFGRPRR